MDRLILNHECSLSLDAGLHFLIPVLAEIGKSGLEVGPVRQKMFQAFSALYSLRKNGRGSLGQAWVP